MSISWPLLLCHCFLVISVVPPNPFASRPLPQFTQIGEHTLSCLVEYELSPLSFPFPFCRARVCVSTLLAARNLSDVFASVCCVIFLVLFHGVFTLGYIGVCPDMSVTVTKDRSQRVIAHCRAGRMVLVVV